MPEPGQARSRVRLVTAAAVALAALAIWFLVPRNKAPTPRAHATGEPTNEQVADPVADTAVLHTVGGGPPPPEATPQPDRSAVAADVPPGASEVEDRRFRVMWGVPGLCADGAGTARQREVTAGFLRTEATTGPAISHDGDVGTFVLMAVEEGIAGGADVIQGLFGVRVDPPEVIVYRDEAQLRAGACVNEAAIAYYDGRIHVSGDPEHGLFTIRQSTVHEYVHHALIKLGVQLPMWLQEGLAMYCAQETWWDDESLGLKAWIKTNHLPFDSMVRAFPHTADERFAVASYFQSFLMVLSIKELHGQGRLADLLRALIERQVTPQDAFGWAHRADAERLEVVWDNFVGRLEP